MNILYLTMNPNRASTTVPTEGWFRLLPERGLRPVLVSREVGAFDAWAKEQGVPTYQDDLPLPDKLRPWRFMRSIERLRRIVKRHEIELIHCNEQDIYPIGRYLAKLCGLPVVVSIHFTMQRPYCEWLFGGWKRPQRIFFVSEGSLDACHSGVEGLIPQADWRVLRNGLDVEAFSPDPARRLRFRNQHGICNEEFVLGVACALRPRKQLEHLIEAARRLEDSRVRVIIAGGPVPGDEQYAEQLIQRSSNQLGDRLLWLGHLGELRDFYNGLDLFVNTSQEEACSISVIESLACGLPVVGYPSKSVDSQILPGGGEIVEQDDINSLTQTLERWMAAPDTSGARRLGARRQAERFDIRKLSDQLFEEYTSLLPNAISTPRLTGIAR